MQNELLMTVGFRPVVGKKDWWKNDKLLLLLHRCDEGRYDLTDTTAEAIDTFEAKGRSPFTMIFAKLAAFLINYHQPSEPTLEESYITDRCSFRYSILGDVRYISIQRHDGKRMGWEEIYAKFASAYPGKWAVQTFPPEDCLINEANMYHLYVFDEKPEGLTLRGF